MGVVFERIEAGKISISNMKLILMSLLVLGPCYGMDAMFKKMMKQTAKHTFDAACFGETNKNNYDLAVGAAIEKCMQLAPAIDLINILSPSSPLKRVFGRQMIFFKCAKKNEMTNCALGQMKRWVEQFYGTAENNTAYGLPEDEYEAA